MKTKQKDKSVKNIVDKKICSGCGACSVVCPQSCIDFIYGQRYNYPRVDTSRCTNCSKCQQVCSGKFLMEADYDVSRIKKSERNLKCYLIHSTDEQIRHDGASGGFITGLILHLIENNQADGAIVARTNPDRPLISQSLIAYDRQTLLECRASRYAPVSSCTVLSEVLEKPGKYVFVGTPCMIESLCKLQDHFPELKDRIVLTIGLVCASMDSHENTKRYLLRNNVDLDKVRRITYRGGGWPGRFRVFGENDEILLDNPLLEDSLIHLVGNEPYLRCLNCIDHWGNDADVVVSDPWCEEMVKSETKGRSGIMIRTARGNDAVESAINSGAMVADPISTEKMMNFNKHLIIDSDSQFFIRTAIYQFLFFGRLIRIPNFIKQLFRGKHYCFFETLKHRLDKKYYY